MEPLLEIRDLHYTYPNGTQALRGISLQIKLGERVAVLGSNGSGKSTLLLCLNGVLKATVGTILLDAQPYDYSTKDLKRVRAGVGVVFQDADTQLFSVDVYQEVAFGPYNLGLRGEALKKRVGHYLDKLDLTELQALPPHYLSGGQKKRVSIASVLSMEPRIMLFDEPTASLDATHVQRMSGLLETFSQGGMSVLLSTHDVDYAFSWANRVVVLREGQVEADGPPEQIFGDKDLLERCGLVQPAVLRIYQCLRNCGKLPEMTEVPRTMDQLEAHLLECV